MRLEKLLILDFKSPPMKRFFYCKTSVVFLLFILPLASFGQYCTPTYVGTGHPATGDPTTFFTHILKVSLSEIDKSTAAPLTLTNVVYNDYRSDTAILTQTGSYPLEIELGNGANTQTFAIWIDYNQNEIFETTEIIATQTDLGNVGAHKYSYTVTVPKNAVLGATRMRVGTIFGPTAPNPCNNSRTTTGTLDWSQHFQDYTIDIQKPVVQKFESVTTMHPTFSEVGKATDDNEILRIDLKTNDDGLISPLTTDSFYFNLLGTTDPDDISSVKLYYTGKRNVFSTGTLVDSKTSFGTDFKLGSNTKLLQGTNYFWLAFDVGNKPILGNLVDAQCTGVEVLSKRVPVVVAPNGNRIIGYCDSRGNKSNFIHVAGVQLNTLNNSPTTTFTDGYEDKTSDSTTLFTGASETLTVEVGNGVNNSFTKVWIDYNADGDFNDLNEQVLFDSITNAANLPGNDDVTATITIPTSAKIGPTRMRVTSESKSDQFPWKLAQQPCDADVDIGEVEDFTVYIAEDGEPVSDFTFSTVCSGDSTAFTDQSFTYSAATSYAINSWKWEFGDGTTSTSQNPKHKYAKPGRYKVALITNTTKPGNADTTYKIVNVEDPKADFILNTTLINEPITFTDQSRGGDVVFWTWNFDDLGSANNIDFSPNPIHEFDTAKTYDVKLEIITLGGCTASVVKSIDIVNELPPIANFNAPSPTPYKGANISLTDVSSNNPTSWDWTITPSTHTYVTGSSTSQNPVVTLNALTAYTIKMVVENGAGKDSISKTFTTKDYSAPTADFSANQTTVKAGQIVSFLDESTNDPTEWEWVFGDGDTSTMSNPIHEYDSTGTFSVKLNIQNPAGSDSESKSNYITVEDEYVMCSSDAFRSPLRKGTLYDSGGDALQYGNSENCEFTIVPDCGGPITLKFNSFFFAANDYLRVFDYDPITQTRTPLHPINTAGFTGSTTPPTLVARSGAVVVEMSTNGNTVAGGFEMEWSSSPNVKPEAALKADTVGYENSTIVFYNDTKKGTGNTYQWDFDEDGITDATNIDKATYTFDKSGTYKIALIASNCKGTDTVYHTIKVKVPTTTPETDFSTQDAGDTLIFAGNEITFIDLSTQGPTSWEWSISGNPFNYLYMNGTDENSRNPEVLFFEPGYYSVTLTTTNGFGKGTTERKRHYILVKPDIRMCVFPFFSEIDQGRITDDGGPDAAYSSTSCDYLIDACGKEIQFILSDFDYDIGDFLRIYDGADNTGIPFHTNAGFTNGDNPVSTVFTATSGSIFIEHRAFANNTVSRGFIGEWKTIPYDDPIVDFSAPKEAFNKGAVTIFTNLTDERDNGAIEYHWDFDNDGVTDDNSATPTHEFTTNGTKTVELKVIACGFADSVTKTIDVKNTIRRPLADFWVSKNVVLTSDIVSLRDSSDFGVAEWQWVITSKNGGTTTIVNGSDKLPYMDLTFDQPDTFDVKLVVSNLFGKDSILKKAEVISIEYCTPTVVNAPSSSTGIGYFELGDIKNSSSAFKKYTDFTQFSTQITQGGTHQVAIGRGTTAPPLNVKVWIDYDRNGVFNDTNETVLTIPSTGKDTLKGKFTVPTYVDDGITRLRVATSFQSDDNDPCGPNNYGEFEDYLVDIGKDVTKPVITLLGDVTETLELGYPFVDPGATAYDNVEGDITSKLVITNNIDNMTEGVYSVWYNVSDASGNKADEVERIVSVGPDQTKPVVTLEGNDPLEMDVFTQFVDPGAKALDNIDGDITAQIVVDASNLDTAVVNEVDGYEVLYTVTDKANNTSDVVARTVLVFDREAPVITLNGSATVVIDLNTESYVEEGATIDDNYYDDVDLIISGTVDDKTVGTYSVYYDATDRSGNSAAQVERTVIVEDPIGFGEIEGLTEFEIFPNPASDVVFVKLDAAMAIDAELQVLDVVGRELYRTPANVNGSNQLAIPVKHLSDGVYYMNLVTSEGKSVRKKFTVAK